MKNNQNDGRIIKTMERISNLTGKAIPETLPFLNYDTSEVCDECGMAKMIYNCPFCGAPNCCYGCGCPSLVDNLCEELEK